MNITLSIDEKLVEDARAVAQRMGTSLNQMIRDHLKQVTGQADEEAHWAAFAERARASSGRLNGWKFDREEANSRER